MKTKRSRERGQSLLEFTLVGIPSIFLMFGIVQLALGMWNYHTLAFAVRAGTRFVIVHGSNCAIAPNDCTVTLGQVAAEIQSAGIGLNANQLNLTFAANSSGSSTATQCVLATCLTNTTTWPPTGVNTPGTSVTISGTYPFVSGISMFWPGNQAASPPFASLTFPATSTDTMQY